MLHLFALLCLVLGALPAQAAWPEIKKGQTKGSSNCDATLRPHKRRVVRSSDSIYSQARLEEDRQRLSVYHANRHLFVLPSLKKVSISKLHPSLNAKFERRMKEYDESVEILLPKEIAEQVRNNDLALAEAQELMSPYSGSLALMSLESGAFEVKRVSLGDIESQPTIEVVGEQRLRFDTRAVANGEYTKILNPTAPLFILRGKKAEAFAPIMAQLTRDHSNTAWRSLYSGLLSLDNSESSFIKFELRELFDHHFAPLALTPREWSKLLLECLNGGAKCEESQRDAMLNFMRDALEKKGIDFIQYSLFWRAKHKVNYFHDTSNWIEPARALRSTALVGGQYSADLVDYFEDWLTRNGIEVFYQEGQAPTRQNSGVFKSLDAITEFLRINYGKAAVWSFALKTYDKGMELQAYWPWERVGREFYRNRQFSHDVIIQPHDRFDYFRAWGPMPHMTEERFSQPNLLSELRRGILPALVKPLSVRENLYMSVGWDPQMPRVLLIVSPIYSRALHDWLRLQAAGASLQGKWTIEDVFWLTEEPDKDRPTDFENIVLKQ